MNLLKELCFSKSFVMVGDSKEKCLECKYCRAITNQKISYNTIPSEINPIFINLPIVVNLFYGDPMLQIDNTLDYLYRLEHAGHKAPVVIITKGDLTLFPKKKFDLDLHFALSTFGIDSKYDGGTMKRFQNNLEYAKSLNNEFGYKYSIEFRPIINSINDSDEILENIFRIASNYDIGIGFCGLQLNENLKEYLKEENIEFLPYDGYELGLKKAISKEIEDKIYSLSEKYKVPSFRKTSCLISYTHSMERDYNAHYYRPNEMRCSKCPMYDKCFKFKHKNDSCDIDSIVLGYEIPFDYEIIDKQKHSCYLFKIGECKFPTNDCVNISGRLIKIKEKITSSDLRVIKWLTGLTIDCEFDEIEFINEKWKK
jgi:hypothetical protein